MHSPRHTATDTPDIVNEDQAAAWNGPEGAHWARHSARRVGDPDLIVPLVETTGIEADDRVLDVGCGTGALARLVAQRAPRGGAVGVDLSTQMIEQARTEAAAEGIANVIFEVGDAQVYPFARGSFDVAVSHFGAMFFGDPKAAFANIASAIRPGGRIGFVCPQAMERCDWYGVPLGALLGHRPTPDEVPSAMFSLADPDVVEQLLIGAGFDSVRLQPLDASLWFGESPAIAAGFYLGSGPGRAILERSDPSLAARAPRVLEAAMAPFVAEDGVRVPGAHWLVTARRATGARR